MHSHYPHQIARLTRIALQLALARVKPPDKTGKTGGMGCFIVESFVEQFVDRIARLIAQPRKQFRATAPWPNQHPVEDAFRCFKIGLVEQITKRINAGCDH